jgi:predicted AAA+ superfamily ATPase
MHTYVDRKIDADVRRALGSYPVTAILGSRQCGKSTLAKYIASSFSDAVFLDMESPADLRKLENPEFFLLSFGDRLICIDEVQRVPNLFPVIRAVVDKNRKNGKFLILGSASQDLIRQSSESLAGRISYKELSPFRFDELLGYSLNDVWLRGGYPESIFKNNDVDSFDWRENFIRTFLERDIPQLGFNLSSVTMRRFWTMLAHNHGQTLNLSKLGASLGVSHTTIRKYIDILAATFMIRILQPFESNIKKRLIKAPKVYIRDSGLLHALLEIETMEELFGHPVYGASWEGFALESVISAAAGWKSYFYRISSGEEIDLVLRRKGRVVAIEFKASTAPKLSRGVYNTLDVIKADKCLVVTPIDEPYQKDSLIRISNLSDTVEWLNNC